MPDRWTGHTGSGAFSRHPAISRSCDSDVTVGAVGVCVQEATTPLHASLSNVPQLATLAKSMVRELDPDNDLEFLRIRTLKHELMVAPRTLPPLALSTLNLLNAQFAHSDWHSARSLHANK